MSEFNEEKLTEILKAAGHDVYLADEPAWCRWQPYGVVAGYNAGPRWPITMYDPDGDELGTANSYDEVLALLAPLLPATATIPAIPLDAEHEARVEEHIREHAPATGGRTFTWAEGSELKAERDSLRAQVEALTTGRDDLIVRFDVLRERFDALANRADRVLKNASGRVLEVGGYSNRRIGAVILIGDRTHLFDLTEEEARRVAGYLYREVALQIVAVTGE